MNKVLGDNVVAHELIASWVSLRRFRAQARLSDPRFIEHDTVVEALASFDNNNRNI